MELTITGDLVKQLSAKAKKDDRLATALAKQLLGAIEPAAMAEFLLTPEITLQLLVERMRSDPDRTVRELTRLIELGPDASAAAQRRRRKGRRRRRLTSQQVANRKQAVLRYLGQHPWATRKELTSAVELPTQAIYRRIMQELQQDGLVISRGQKSKMVYALKGTRGGPGR